MALAYLDAGSGSLIIAALAGGAAGVAVLLKLYWNRFLGVFSKNRRERAAELKADLGVDSSEDVQLEVD
jgi:hypothetical protein